MVKEVEGIEAGRVMSVRDEQVDTRPLTSIELLDAAVWREIGSEEARAGCSLSGCIVSRSQPVAPGAIRGAGNGCPHCAMQSTGLPPGGRYANERHRMEQINQTFAFARRAEAQRKSGKKTRAFAVAVMIALLLVCTAVAAGLRINGTHSFPVGLYLATGKKPERGDLVFVNPPALPLFALAKERGYLGVGYSASGCGYLIKRLAGVAGDRVTIDAAGVEVNGIRLANSNPYNYDGAGRPLQPYLLTDHILDPGEVLLMSDYSPASFDARYFGPLQATTIESVIKPLLTWN
jgi:conjugative transfer signal peptidase TraF